MRNPTPQERASSFFAGPAKTHNANLALEQIIIDVELAERRRLQAQLCDKCRREVK